MLKERMNRFSNPDCVRSLYAECGVKEQVATEYELELRGRKATRCSSPLFSRQCMQRGPAGGPCSRDGCVPFTSLLYWTSLRRALHRANAHSRSGTSQSRLTCWLFRKRQETSSASTWDEVTGSHRMLSSVRIRPSPCENITYCGVRKIIFLLSLEVLLAGLIIKLT